ncbi:MAG: hypothetical protein QM800_15215 [Paludibacter sp.]
MEENNSKEINLLQLIGAVINWIGNLAKSILTLVGKIIKLTYKYKVVTGSVLLVCVVYGQYLARPSARVYNAEAMAMLYGSEAETVKEVSKQLENTLGTNKLVSFATKLSLPDSVAKNIVSFRSFYVIDYLKDRVADKVDFANNHSLTDTLNLKMKDRLYFQVKIKKINQMPQIQAALLGYFNRNVLMKTEFEQKRNDLVNRIQICNTESHRIDSLAKISYFKDVNQQLSLENNKVLLGEQRKQLFYDELLRLNDIRSYSELRLAEFKQPVDLPF